MQEARQNLYAQHVMVGDFGDKPVDACKKADRAAAPARTQQLHQRRQKSRQLDHHGRVGNEFLSQFTRQVGALYADGILFVPRVCAVPNAKQEIDDATKVLDALERLRVPVETAIGKTRAVVATLPA